MQMQLSWFTADEAFPFFIQLGWHEQSLETHTHADFSELVIVLGGTAVHTVKGEEYLLRKGDVFVINEDTAHGLKSPHNLRICNIMFRKSLFMHNNMDVRKSAGFHALFMIDPALSRERPYQSYLRLPADEFEAVSQRLEDMLNEYRKQAVGYQTCLIAQLLGLAVTLSRRYEKEPMLKDTKGMRIAAPLAYMENNFTREINLKQLADLSNLSTRHFDRIFQDAYHTTPKTYIAQLRMAHARALLARTQMPITDVAFDCGYQDSNYFARVFKKYCGVSPARYRAQAVETT